MEGIHTFLAVTQLENNKIIIRLTKMPNVAIFVKKRGSGDEIAPKDRKVTNMGRTNII